MKPLLGTLWKFYKYLDEKIGYADKLFWIPSGNTVGFYKYNGHIPWDDDIDIGFQIEDSFEDYITFLINCIKGGFNVNLHIIVDENKVAEWYDNNKVVNLVLNNKNPSWEHIKESDFRELMRVNPSKLCFGNVTLTEHAWKKICGPINI